MPKKKPTRNTPAVAHVPTRCRKCGSTDRTVYRGCNAQEFAGIAPDGQSYTHIIRKYTTCKNCFQVRVDIFHEQRSRKPKRPDAGDVNPDATTT